MTDENLRRVDAIEIKIGQSAKPGMGGFLPGEKVTSEIAQVRGRSVGIDIISPARFSEIQSAEDLKHLVDWLREQSAGKPIGIKIAAGNLEADLEFALSAGPDFITVDGRAGADRCRAQSREGCRVDPDHLRTTSSPEVAGQIPGEERLAGDHRWLENLVRFRQSDRAGS